MFRSNSAASSLLTDSPDTSLFLSQSKIAVKERLEARDLVLWLLLLVSALLLSLSSTTISGPNGLSSSLFLPSLRSFLDLLVFFSFLVFFLLYMVFPASFSASSLALFAWCLYWLITKSLYPSISLEESKLFSEKSSLVFSQLHLLSKSESK